MHTLTTARLTLRQWLSRDLEPFAALNADPAVMEFMPALLSREQSAQFIARATADLERRGFGLWAVEERASGALVGCVGLNVPSFEAPFTPCVEILWRLAAHSWGRGFATEAARACLELGFGTLGLAEVVAFTVPRNTRSRAVMERLGMRRDAHGDFAHPRLPPQHPLAHHVLYRLPRAAWRTTGNL
ncbi:MAG TPA: GNAT family N-acetyltransferase [Steroidobacteraceae bacterium]|nr:GNAT family N-acetyltransferase [Gammaproteobacteria bacterium]HEV2285364.1 GNAT family N-acetyltransferase [Steroidobacteraceae bacterium]